VPSARPLGGNPSGASETRVQAVCNPRPFRRRPQPRRTRARRDGPEAVRRVERFRGGRAWARLGLAAGTSATHQDLPLRATGQAGGDPGPPGCPRAALVCTWQPEFSA
jgi:hypothetical protein